MPQTSKHLSLKAVYQTFQSLFLIKKFLSRIISSCQSWLCKNAWAVKPSSSSQRSVEPGALSPDAQQQMSKEAMVPPWNTPSLHNICRLRTCWSRTITAMLSNPCYVFLQWFFLNSFQTHIDILHWQTSAKSYITMLYKNGKVWICAHREVRSLDHTLEWKEF